MVNEIGRIKVVTSGWTGGPGLSQLYFTGATHGTVTNGDCVTAAAAVNAFYASTQGYYPTTWSNAVDGTVQVIDATTGALLREETITPPAPNGGTGGTSWGSTASGILVAWHTGAVFGRRLLRGRTFCTPVSANAYGANGQVLVAARAAFAAAGATLAVKTPWSMVVWHRPSPGGSNGGYGTMTGASSPVAEAILRSRRD